MFGDNLTNAPLSGRTPRLNDNAVVGARYNFNYTDRWGIQLYDVIDNLYVNVEARYRYLNRLVSGSNQSLNTTETTLGIGWRF